MSKEKLSEMNKEYERLSRVYEKLWKAQQIYSEGRETFGNDYIDDQIEQAQIVVSKEMDEIREGTKIILNSE